jgi:hypothetical protein
MKPIRRGFFNVSTFRLTGLNIPFKKRWKRVVSNISHRSQTHPNHPTNQRDIEIMSLQPKTGTVFSLI